MKIPSPKFLVCGTLACLVVSGCETVNQVVELGTEIGVASGAIDQGDADSINRGTRAVTKTFEDITPEQEYYIGRAVAATVLNTYKVHDDAEANRYLNLLGQSLARVSKRPETFGGYHFIVLDTDEVNAFAAPGGFIMVSRGLLRCATSEDALASVLAHEIGHVQNQHGLRAIKKGRLNSALTILAAEGAKQLVGEQLAEVTKAFEESIGDVVTTMMNSGYARELEAQSDADAVTILKSVGYSPQGLVTMLEEMARHVQEGDQGFGATHPSPEARIQSVQKLTSGADPVSAHAVRDARFKAFRERI